MIHLNTQTDKVALPLPFQPLDEKIILLKYTICYSQKPVYLDSPYRPQNLTLEKPALRRKKITHLHTHPPFHILKFQVQFSAPWYDQQENMNRKGTQWIFPTNMALSPKLQFYNPLIGPFFPR